GPCTFGNPQYNVTGLLEADNTHDVTIVPTDCVGNTNTTAELTFNVDTSAPTNSSIQPALTDFNKGTVELTFTFHDNVTNVAHIRCLLDSPNGDNPATALGDCGDTITTPSKFKPGLPGLPPKPYVSPLPSTGKDFTGTIAYHQLSPG